MVDPSKKVINAELSVLLARIRSEQIIFVKWNTILLLWHCLNTEYMKPVLEIQINKIKSMNPEIFQIVFLLFL